MPIIAAGVILWLLSSAKWGEVLIVAAILAIASALFVLRRGHAGGHGATTKPVERSS